MENNNSHSHFYPKGTPHKEIEHCDVLILGAGPAGLTAAIYAARYNLKVAVIAKSFGGTANLAGNVENWPGFKGSGKTLAKKIKKQAEEFGAHFIEAEIESVRKDIEGGFIFETKNEEIHGKTVILCLGSEHRKLDIPGEKEFLGKGVSYCATCDGNFFKKKTVAVIGGADSAAKSAIYLSEICEKVYIIYRRDEIRCEPIVLQKLKEKQNIEIIYHSNPKKILGEKKVEAIEIEIKEQGKKPITKKINVNGIFIEIGATPVSEIVNPLNLELTAEGYIITDKQAKTNVPGVFAAGDNTNNHFKQLVTAAAEGAIAAKSAYDFLKSSN